MTTGTKAAATQPSWNLVSNCANARPRLASGASRCTMASKARRANAAADAHEAGQQRGADLAAAEGGEQAADGDEDEGQRQHPLLVLAAAQDRPERVAGHASRWR